MTEEIYDHRPVADDEILRCRVGSRAYGTDTPESDEDIKGIYVHPKESVIGIASQKPTRQYNKDEMSYSLRHFVALATKCVPNVLELLFCRPEDVLLLRFEGDLLRNSRDLFLTKKCVAPYIGYARGQLGKAAKKPQRRGQGRTALIEEHGYDTKFALHTIRLLQTAKEILTDGVLNVYRPNAEFLLQIRNGIAFGSFTEFSKFAYSLIEETESLKDKSSLPNQPNMEKINTLVIEIHEEYWAG